MERIKNRVFLNNKMSARGAICDFPTTNTVNAKRREESEGVHLMNERGRHSRIHLLADLRGVCGR